MSKLGTRIIVKQDPDNVVEKDVLATAIVKISEAAEALKRSGLNQRAVVVLLSDKTKYGKSMIEDVLDGLADLKRDYTRA